MPPESEALIKVYNLKDSVEALEINEGENNYLSLHFTTPEQEVLLSSDIVSAQFEDIASDSFGDGFDESKDLPTIGADLIRVGTTTKLSITYNVQRVHD